MYLAIGSIVGPILLLLVLYLLATAKIWVVGEIRYHKKEYGNFREYLTKHLRTNNRQEQIWFLYLLILIPIFGIPLGMFLMSMLWPFGVFFIAIHLITNKLTKKNEKQ